jgi:hypothetical protein
VASPLKKARVSEAYIIHMKGKIVYHLYTLYIYIYLLLFCNSPESENPDAILGGSQQYDDEDISHFVSYIFKNGFIWKLDSLNINPTKVMKVENEERWPKVLEHILVEKVGSGYSSNTFLAIKKDRIAEIEETLADMVLCEHNLGAQLKEMITAIYETNIFAILHPSALNPKINMTYDDREITREIITIKEKHLDILKYEMVERISRIEKLEKTLSPTHSSTEAFANKSEADSTELQDSFETCTAKDKSKKKKRSKPKDESSEPEEKGTKKRKRNDNNEGKDSKKPTKKQKHPRE